jgi:hypothetical protein
MSCSVALAATLFLAASTPADANPSLLVRAVATAPATSVASEPLFADIVARAQRLKAESDAFRQTPGMDASAGPVVLSGFDAFQAHIAELAALDMQGHLELAKRGTDGDLKCILKGISQDLPIRLREFTEAKTGPAQKAALAEMSYLLNDNVEVITAPPKPPV